MAKLEKAIKKDNNPENTPVAEAIEGKSDKKKKEGRLVKKDNRPVKILNSRIISDLGCVDYAFFDKTDTLAQNLIEISLICTSIKAYDIETENIPSLIKDIKKQPHKYVRDKVDD